MKVCEQKHFPNETKQVGSSEVVKRPTLGAWFEVNPLAIDQKLFEKKRDDLNEEDLRKTIIKAFEELKKRPEKYGRKFKTLVLENGQYGFIGGLYSLRDCVYLGCEIGDHLADEVEQFLEVAQRIANGESWEALCDKPDTITSHRLLRKALYSRRGFTYIGGQNAKSATSLHFVYKDENEPIAYGRPLVVLYE